MKRGRHGDVGIVAGLHQSVPQRPCCSCTWGGAPWSLVFLRSQSFFSARSLARSLVSFFSTTSCPRLLVVSIFFLFLPHFFLFSFFFFFFLSFLLRPPLSDPRTLFLLFVLALYFSQSRFFVTPLSARPPSSSSGVAAHSHRTCVTGDVIQLVS